MRPGTRPAGAADRPGPRHRAVGVIECRSGGRDGPPRRWLGGQPQHREEPPHRVRLGHRAQDRRAPPQRSQTSTWMANTRRSKRAQFSRLADCSPPGGLTAPESK